MRGNELTPTERRELSYHENIIERGLVGFVEVGKSLAWVRDTKIYLYTHPSFEEYCKEKWDVSRQQAYKLISASLVTNMLDRERVKLDESGATIKPINESQAQPLYKLIESGDKEVANCWAEVIDTAPTNADGTPHITSKHVEETVHGWIEADEPYVEEPTVEPVEEVRVDPMVEWNGTLESFCRGLVAFASENYPVGPWLDTNRAAIALEQVKSAASTYRLATGKGECPECDGDGCEKCKQTGFMPRRELEMNG